MSTDIRDLKPKEFVEFDGCTVCNGLGWVTKDPETRAVARCPECALADATSWIDSVLPREFRNIPVDITLRRALRAVVDKGWPWQGGPWSVTLWGPNGTGKTYEATYLWREAVRRTTKPCAWISLDKALEDARRGVNGPEEKEFVDKTLRSGVVLFDELTNEKQGTIRERLVIEALTYRYDYQLPTIVTTNLSAKDFEDKRLASRLRAGIAIHYGGDDRRSTPPKEFK